MEVVEVERREVVGTTVPHHSSFLAATPNLFHFFSPFLMFVDHQQDQREEEAKFQSMSRLRRGPNGLPVASNTPPSHPAAAEKALNRAAAVLAKSNVTKPRVSVTARPISGKTRVTGRVSTKAVTTRVSTRSSSSAAASAYSAMKSSDAA